jgi:CO/xanthine dehydrogenase Mo-binding subunit
VTDSQKTGKYVGQRIKRNEDPRLLTGQALFVDDVDLPGMSLTPTCGASTSRQPEIDRE